MTSSVAVRAAFSRDEIVGRVRELGPVFTERAMRYDREAIFPTENFADLKEAGLLALCVPAEQGGLGVSFADYARVSAEIGRYCGATALTFNMHNATMLWAGEVADMLDFPAEEQALHNRRRTELFRGVVEDGTIHSQPFSEGISAGATSGVHTKAVPVDGGFLITGRKIFASLAGAAHRYNVTCQVPGEPFIRLLSIDASAGGIEIVGDWDPLGMRGTVSRTLLFTDAFVPSDAEVLPPHGYDQAARRFPFLFISLAPSYLGLTQGILDFTRAYLRGEAPGQRPGSARRDHPHTMGAADSPEDVESRHRLWRAAYFAASPAEFPHTTRLAPLLYPSLDEQFEFGIAVLIDGLRRRASLVQDSTASRPAWASAPPAYPPHECRLPADRASSQPPAIHWNGQNRVAGW